MLALGVEAKPFCALPLRARDGSVRSWTLVDAEDYEQQGEHDWRLSSTGYASRKQAGVGRYLHRELLGLEQGDKREGDHINRDRLDNRRANLRVVTRREQLQNLSPRRRYRGVINAASVNRSKPWMARAQLDGQVYHLGYFATEEEAGAAAAAWRAENMPYSEEAA